MDAWETIKKEDSGVDGLLGHVDRGGQSVSNADKSAKLNSKQATFH